MKPVTSYWICRNGRYYRWRGRAGCHVQRFFDRLSAGRWMARQTWLRYHADLDAVPPAPPHVRLTPLTEELVQRLRRHRDRHCNQLVSAFRFWDHGLRRAYIWMEEDEPVCLQWLLLPQDNPLLARLPDWAGMYPPLEIGAGQVENLFKFSSSVPRRNVAVDFELALYEQARQLGLGHLLTHIHEHNEAANRFAQRACWQPAGRIGRYQLRLPGLRRRPLYVHELIEGVAVQTQPDLEVA